MWHFPRTVFLTSACAQQFSTCCRQFMRVLRVPFVCMLYTFWMNFAMHGLCQHWVNIFFTFCTHVCSIWRAFRVYTCTDLWCIDMHAVYIVSAFAQHFFTCFPCFCVLYVCIWYYVVYMWDALCSVWVNPSFIFAHMFAVFCVHFVYIFVFVWEALCYACIMSATAQQLFTCCHHFMHVLWACFVHML